MSDSHNRRIEHRIAGADVNPYILASVILAGLLASERFTFEQCPRQLTDNAVALPLRMPDALIKLASSELMSMYLPKPFISLYLACKQRELADFEKAVTPLEVDWMLHSA